MIAIYKKREAVTLGNIFVEARILSVLCDRLYEELFATINHQQQDFRRGPRARKNYFPSSICCLYLLGAHEKNQCGWKILVLEKFVSPLDLAKHFIAGIPNFRDIYYLVVWVGGPVVTEEFFKNSSLLGVKKEKF